MRGTATQCWRHFGSETVHGELLVGVVVLDDAADLLDCLEILVLGHIQIVEGVAFGGVAVRQSEVDTDGQLDLAAAEDVFEEAGATLEIARFELYVVLGYLVVLHELKVSCSFLELTQIALDVA